MTDPIKVTVDGHQVEAVRGEYVIAVAERAGVYIPRFCYHPRMRTVGMCRMCLVNIDGGRGPALTASCVAEVSDGMVVDTRAPEVKKAQDGVLEFLLINHPLDCPVCDKGGECPLQDQTLHFGPGESRFVEEKRHFEKPIPISPLVLLDRERCILCDRCTRFSKEIAGDPLIHFIGRGNGTEVNTFPDHPFASYFSGNVVQLCPVGALTSAAYRFTARPWDIERIESTCTSCAVGCRVAVESTANRMTRYQGLDSDPVNQTWLCDRGRYDFEWVNSEERLTAPLIRKGDELVEASWGEALAAAEQQLSEVLRKHGPEAIGVIGGARLTNEDCYAWAKFAKGVLGTDNVDAQLGDGLPPEMVVGLPPATIDDACGAGAVVLIGPDLKEELPVLFLRLRGAIADRGLKVVELTPRPTSMTGLATVSVLHRPGDVAAVAAALVADQDPVGEEVGGAAVSAVIAARRILGNTARVIVVIGRQSLAESSDGVVGAAGALLRGLPWVRFLPALRRGNVRGALDLGLAPGLLPGRVTLEAGRAWYLRHWPNVPESPGMDTAGMLTAAAEGRLHVLILLGADPLSDFPDRDLARRALTSVGTVIAVDTFLTDSSRHATVVLAAAGYGEKSGSTTNIEGRVTRLGQKVVARGTARADWMIASELAAQLGADLGPERVEDLWDEIERVAPAHAGLTRALLHAPGRVDGVLVPPVGDPAAGARTLAEVIGADPRAAYEPPTVVDGATGGIGVRIKGGLAVNGSGAPAAPGTDIGTDTGINAGADVATDIGADAGAGASSDAAGEAEPDARGDADAVGDPGTGTGDDVAAADAGPGARAGSDAGAEDEPALEQPAPLVWSAPDRVPPVPKLDAYSLRLVSARVLYDLAVSVVSSPHLAGLGRAPAVLLHPAELERLGVAPGRTVRITSSRGSVTMPAAADPHLPKGTASLTFNVTTPGAADLIDAGAPVTEVRLEGA